MEKDKVFLEKDFPPKSLNESVYAVFAFFDMFDYPLKIEEIQGYMLGYKASVTELESFLDNDPRICFSDGFYYLGGRELLILIRQKREEIAKRYWKKVMRYTPFLKIVPFIKMVAVCNTLAFNNPKEGSDIDLFIITNKGRIFTARTLSTLLFWMLGVRRHGEKVAKRFCLSFYVSEDGMNLSDVSLRPFDVYMIYWMKTLKPVFGEDVLSIFLEHNSEGDFFSDYENVEGSKSGLKCFGDFLERKLKKLTLKRYERKKVDLDENSSVIVNSKMLKFHNVDRRDEIKRLFMKKYTSLVG